MKERTAEEQHALSDTINTVTQIPRTTWDALYKLYIQYSVSELLGSVQQDEGENSRGTARSEWRSQHRYTGNLNNMRRSIQALYSVQCVWAAGFSAAGWRRTENSRGTARSEWRSQHRYTGNLNNMTRSTSSIFSSVSELLGSVQQDEGENSRGTARSEWRSQHVTQVTWTTWDALYKLYIQYSVSELLGSVQQDEGENSRGTARSEWRSQHVTQVTWTTWDALYKLYIQYRVSDCRMI